MYWNIYVCILHAYHEYEKPKQAATILHYKILKLNDITNERFWFFHIENKRGVLKQKSSPCKKAVKELTNRISIRNQKMSQIERHNQDIHVGLETYLPILPRFRPLILRGFGGRTRFRHLVKTKSNIRTESLIHRTVITIPMWHWEPSQTSMNCACACICLSQKRGKKSNFTVTCFLFSFIWSCEIG